MSSAQISSKLVEHLQAVDSLRLEIINGQPLKTRAAMDLEGALWFMRMAVSSLSEYEAKLPSQSQTLASSTKHTLSQHP